MKTLAIAAVTLREVLSRKVQVNLLLFGLLLVLASYVASSVTLGWQHRIIADLGLSAMQLVTVLLATFLSSAAIAGDVERRVLYAVIAKPVTRPGYLLGRYLGLAAALVANVAAMGLLLAALLCLEAGSTAPLEATLVLAIALTAVQALVVAALGILFSSFTTTTLAAIFTLGLAVAGHLSSEVRTLWKGGAAWLPALIWRTVPDLSSLTLNEAVVYHTRVGAQAAAAVVYAALYAATVLALAAAAFQRRDFR